MVERTVLSRSSDIENWGGYYVVSELAKLMRAYIVLFVILTAIIVIVGRE